MPRARVPAGWGLPGQWADAWNVADVDAKMLQKK